jgi:hypothetical protein
MLKGKKKGSYAIIQIDPNYEPAPIEHKEVFGVTFEQGRNDLNIDEHFFDNIVTENKDLPEKAKIDMAIAMITLKYTQSNSVCFVKNGQAIGVGAGQQSRIHCVRLAGQKADNWLLRQAPQVLNLPFIEGMKRANRDNAIDLYIGEDYMDVLADGRWEKIFKEYIAQLAKEEEERQLLEARTIDKVQPGEQQPETDHKMETDNSFTGNTNDVFYRDARDGHYFSYLMQTGGKTDLDLQLKYWGVGEWKTHEFDIFIDDVLVKSVNNTGKYRISEFKTETYDIPSSVLKDKTQVRIKFVARQGKQIGEIYGVRLLEK